MSTVINVTIYPRTGSAFPDPVVVKQPDTMLSFALDYDSIQEGWTFVDTDAITVTAGGSQFIGSWTFPNTLQCALVDLKTVNGPYNYTVDASDPLLNRVRLQFKFDPTIENNSD